MKMDEIEAMKRAIAVYAGPVTRRSPGKARAKPLRRKKVLESAHPQPLLAIDVGRFSPDKKN